MTGLFQPGPEAREARATMSMLYRNALYYSIVYKCYNMAYYTMLYFATSALYFASFVATPRLCSSRDAPEGAKTTYYEPILWTILWTHDGATLRLCSSRDTPEGRKRRALILRGTKGVPREGVRRSVNMRVRTRKEMTVNHDETSCYSRPPFLGTPLVPCIIL